MIAHALCMLLAAAPLKVGDEAPDFSAADTDGAVFRLGEAVKSAQVVLAFFPKAFTSGCTQELKAYRDMESRAKAKGVRIVAVSNDDADTLKRFKGELQALYTFVPDPEGKVIALYGVRQWPLQMARRHTFVVNDKQKITRIDAGSDALKPASVFD